MLAKLSRYTVLTWQPRDITCMQPYSLQNRRQKNFNFFSDDSAKLITESTAVSAIKVFAMVSHSKLALHQWVHTHSGTLRTGYRPIIKTRTWTQVNGDNWNFTEAWPMVAKSTQLRERASTELAKFHCSSSIVRSSLYRYAHRLSSRVKLLCSGARVYYLFGSTGISKRLLETTTISQR